MKFLIAVLMLVISMPSFAQKRIVSVDAFDLTYTGGILIKSDNAKRGSDRKETTFRFNLNYAQAFEQYEGLMWKAQVHLNREDVDYNVDTLRSQFGLAGGVVYNFQPEDIKNSVMAGALVGLERATYDNGVTDESGINLFLNLEGGKRWDLGQYSVANISYAPTVSVQFKRYGGDIRDNQFKNGHEIKLNFLKFDILF